jgi:hypothetical protein
MNASIVVAICATVIAVLALAVSVYEARATRRHDRISVRPFLELRVGLRQGSTAGLQLINAGLGPAAITKTVLTLDGDPLGESARRASTYSAASSRSVLLPSHSEGPSIRSPPPMERSSRVVVSGSRDKRVARRILVYAPLNKLSARPRPR